MENIYQNIKNFDLLKLLQKSLKKADTPFIYGFIAAFMALNLIFLYHGTHFMFGDHDWKYLKDGLKLSDGLFEGRFSQFLLINALADGDILPIINNFLGFFFFTLGIALLAKYWQLPQKKHFYIIFCLFTAVTPYILSFMYFAFLVAPVLSWNAFIIGALIISEKETSFSLLKTFFATLFIFLALGGYPPVLNLLAVALTTRIIIAHIYENKQFGALIKNYRWSIINIILAGIGYKLALIYFTHIGAINSSYYNLQTTPINQWGEKALLILKDLFLEFVITLPFIETPYKTCIILITILAFTVICKKSGIIRCFLGFMPFLAGLITLFLSASLKETEFSPRIDFFGFMYATAAMVAIIFKSTEKSLKNLAYIICISAILLNTHSLFEAQKVWKLGFDAELKLYKRVAKRFQTAPLFNIKNYYIMVQGGSPSFRERFYHTSYKHKSDDLLSISYVPGMAAGVMWDYYGIRDYIDKTSYIYTFRPDTEIKQALRNGKPWPKEESVKVGGYWILVTFTEDGLEYLRQNYLND